MHCLLCVKLGLDEAWLWGVLSYNMEFFPMTGMYNFLSIFDMLSL